MFFEKITNREEFITAFNVQKICNQNNIIFCHVGDLDKVFQQIKHDCVLVCTDTDGCILPKDKIKKHVNPQANVTFQLDYHINSNDIIPSNIKRIYSANVDVNHLKIIAMPRGIENFHQMTYLKKPEKIIEAMSSSLKRDKLLYVNHNIDTNKDDRKEPYEIFKTNNWCTIERGTNGSNFDNFIYKLRTHKFVLSPDGNSLEAHRTWEALYIGTIPVVKRHVFTEELSKELPILVIDKWGEITEKFLEEKYEEFENRIYNYDLLKISYWKKRIYSELK
jgi:hypothetical protein